MIKFLRVMTISTFHNQLLYSPCLWVQYRGKIQQSPQESTNSHLQSHQPSCRTQDPWSKNMMRRNWQSQLVVHSCQQIAIQRNHLVTKNKLWEMLKQSFFQRMIVANKFCLFIQGNWTYDANYTALSLLTIMYTHTWSICMWCYKTP